MLNVGLIVTVVLPTDTLTVHTNTEADAAETMIIGDFEE